MAEAFAEQYVWVHEGWSPVGSRAALAEVAAATVDELDSTTSVGSWVEGRLVAVAWSFPAGNGLVEVVAEAQSRDVRNGVRLLAGVVARCLTAAADAGYRRVEFDGHVSDPHLAPVVASMPLAGVHPLLLMEIP